jgi:chromosome segregation protein
VTAIVGPNGCGKSNIVDAVRWVLGEQRESALRSERMDNVIFGGSSRRRPLGMAEISLTLHDTDGSLPIEFNEVTITRRLFRSGKSEYLLNKTVCRLKDLMDLFMDTGVGSDSYSIIELKMVEDIISEDPDQMRSLLDEATGITRYKARRKEALRRLLEARQDRERALDILVEVERQANGLKRQVARVRAYKRLEERARRVRSAIILGEVRKLEASLAPMEDSLNQWQIEMQRTSGDLSGGEAELMRLEGELLQLENDRQDCAYRFNAAQSDFQSATGLKARNEEEIRLNRWRMEKNREETEKTSTDLKGVEEQIQVAQSDLEACQANWPAVEARLRERQLTFQQADEKFRETRAKSIQNAEKLRSLRAREAEAIRLSEERRAALNSRQARLEELHQRKAELQENLQKKKEDLAQAESELAEKSRKLSEVRSRHAEIDDNIEKLREQLRDLEQELDQASARRDRRFMPREAPWRRSFPIWSAPRSRMSFRWTSDTSRPWSVRCRLWLILGSCRTAIVSKRYSITSKASKPGVSPFYWVRLRI